MVKAQSSKLNVNCSLFATFRASRLRTAIISSCLRLQGWCKANAEASLLGLCWAAAHTRNAFPKCIAKLLNFLSDSKFAPSARVLMWTYVNLWVLTPGIWTFSLQNAPLFCIFVVRLINTIYQLCLLPIITIKTPMVRLINTIYQLCLLPIITIKTPINRRPSVAWSSPRVISLSFCLALPGKSSRDSYAKIQTSQASLSSVDERFFLQR